MTDSEVAIFPPININTRVSIRGYLKRYYPYGDALTHILGYVAKINDRDLNMLDREGTISNYKATRDIGKIGIERYYENILHGTAGYQEVEINSSGRIIRTLKYVPPKPGKNIMLTLDIELQLYLRSILDDRRAAAIVLDAKDSGIRFNTSYDPNDRSRHFPPIIASTQ